jgi:3-dehydroquinate dehydratase-2
VGAGGLTEILIFTMIFHRHYKVMKIIIINGPNLNLLGRRQPHLYGNKSFKDYFKDLQSHFPDIDFDIFQSNHVGELIDKIQETGFSYDGIILNAAGYTHTSVALADAVAAIDKPVIEVHMTNIYARESFRQQSFISPFAKAVITGFGLDSYRLAILGLIDYLESV